MRRDMFPLSVMRGGGLRGGGNGYKFKPVQLWASKKIRPVEETITDK